MKADFITLKCSCGRPIQPENIFGSMVYCDVCGAYKVLMNNDILKPVFNKIVPFPQNARYYRQLLLDYFCRYGDAQLFKRLKLTTGLKRYYVPVREIGSGMNRQFIALNEANKEIYNALFYNGILKINNWENALPEEKIRNLLITDHRPIYTQTVDDRVEFLNIDVSMYKLDQLYHIDQNQSLIIKYLPVFILGTNLGDVVCIGVDENFVIVNEDEVRAVICVPPKVSWLKKSKEKIKDAAGILLFLCVVAGIIYGIYYFFTVGLTFSSFFNGLFKIILWSGGAILLALWCLLWIALYIGGFILIFAPILCLIIAFMSVVKENKARKAPNIQHGKKMLKLM